MLNIICICKFYTILLSIEYNKAFVNVLNKLLNY